MLYRIHRLMRLIAAAAPVTASALIQILDPLAHSPVRTPGGHSGWRLLRAFSSRYVVACTPTFILYIALRNKHLFFTHVISDETKQKERTYGCTPNSQHISGQSDSDSRTELLQHPTHLRHHHQSRESICKTALLYPSSSRPAKRGTNSCPQTLASPMFLVQYP
jgi:hypothetical protein